MGYYAEFTRPDPACPQDWIYPAAQSCAPGEVLVLHGMSGAPSATLIINRDGIQPKRMPQTRPPTGFAAHASRLRLWATGVVTWLEVRILDTSALRTKQDYPHMDYARARVISKRFAALGWARFERPCALWCKGRSTGFGYGDAVGAAAKIYGCKVDGIDDTMQHGLPFGAADTASREWVAGLFARERAVEQITRNFLLGDWA